MSYREEEVTVRIVLDLPSDIVDWIDDITAKMGLNNRGTVVAAMLRELFSDQDSTDL
jgi:metal-responsive CopG/Arc/MetJ family transcriptional regulator